VRVENFVETDGSGRGARRIRLINGSGIEMDLHPDRALDIGRVTVGGIPVAWMSPTGMVGPESYDPVGNGWLRTFGGGLLATCGLDTFGPPSHDHGDALGQHGRIGTQRAAVVRSEATEAGVVVEAVVRQSAVFGENLVLRRRISTEVGSDTFLIEDTVTNESFDESPHMILYHMNLGWPLLDEHAVVDIPSSGVTARDAVAEAGVDSAHLMGPPVAGYEEQVFIHRLPEGPQAVMTVSNEPLGIAFELTVSPTSLPVAYEWKMTGQGHYVLGIEPSNTPAIFGRARARADGQLPMLSPGESVSYRLSLRFRRLRGE
jgi:hypothetical protein